MVEVRRDGVMIDTRFYDGADRVVQTGPAATLAQGYVEQLNNGPVGNGSETRINRYDADGHLLHQQVAKSDGAPKYDIDYQVDAAGNVVATTDVTHGENGYTASYAYTQLRQDGYKEATITGTRTDNAGAPGQTTDSYDVNGTLVGIADSTKAENNRTFISDAAGIVLQKTQQGHVQRQIVVGGQVVGQLGSGLDPRQPIDKDGNQTYIDYQNFNLGYRAVDANYPTAEAGSTVVQAGDTLQGLAQKAYGDAQLWYLIADANGIQGNSDLRVGQTLQLPNRVGTVHNNAGTFKPYEAGKVLGDTTPNLPAPSGGDDCGGFGQILVVVIAVVVTVLTGCPILASIISQGVGMATGVQKDFSWSAVALAAIGGAVSNGLEGVAPLGGEATSFGNTVARSMIGNTVTQGIGVATGLQKEFSWVGVAAAGVGAGVGYGVSEALGITSNGARTTAFGKAGFGEQVVKAGLTGFAAGLATAVARGGRISVTQVAVDAFGNALGNSLANYANGPGQSEQELQQREDARDAGIARALNGASSGDAPLPGTGLQMRAGDAERFYPMPVFGSGPAYPVAPGASLGNSPYADSPAQQDTQQEWARPAQANAFDAADPTNIARAQRFAMNSMAANGVEDPSLPQVITERSGYGFPIPNLQDYPDKVLPEYVVRSEPWTARDEAEFLNSGLGGVPAVPQSTSFTPPVQPQIIGEKPDGGLVWDTGAVSYPVATPTIEERQMPGAPNPFEQFQQRPTFDANGNVTGTEDVPVDTRPVMRYGDQMSNALSAVGQIVTGGAKGLVNGVPATIAEVDKGYMYLGTQIGELTGLLSPGATSRMIGSLSSVTGRVFDYENGLQAMGGVVGEMASPGAYVEGAKLGIAGMRALGPTAGGMFEGYMQRTGLLLYAVPESAGASSAVPEFTSKVHGAIEQNLSVGELAEYKLLDPNAKIGLTGSSATGRVGNPNKPTFGQLIDPNKFDLDLFIQSDVLLEQFGTKLKSAPVFRQSLVDGFPELFGGLKPGKSGVSIKFRSNGSEPKGSVMFEWKESMYDFAK